MVSCATAQAELCTPASGNSQPANVTKNPKIWVSRSWFLAKNPIFGGWIIGFLVFWRKIQSLVSRLLDFCFLASCATAQAELYSQPANVAKNPKIWVSRSWFLAKNQIFGGWIIGFLAKIQSLVIGLLDFGFFGQKSNLWSLDYLIFGFLAKNPKTQQYGSPNLDFWPNPKTQKIIRGLLHFGFLECMGNTFLVFGFGQKCKNPKPKTEQQTRIFPAIGGPRGPLIRTVPAGRPTGVLVGRCCC